MQQRKNFENQLIFGENINNHKVGRFGRYSVYL